MSIKSSQTLVEEAQKKIQTLTPDKVKILIKTFFKKLDLFELLIFFIIVKYIY